MSDRKFTKGLNKPGSAAQLREQVSNVVRESANLVSHHHYYSMNINEKSLERVGLLYYLLLFESSLLFSIFFIPESAFCLPTGILSVTFWTFPHSFRCCFFTIVASIPQTQKFFRKSSGFIFIELRALGLERWFWFFGIYLNWIFVQQVDLAQFLLV